MRGRGGIAVVLAVSGAVALSVPAHADEYDFISELDSSGVYYESILDMIDVGKELCHDLRSGVTPPVVLGKLANSGFAAAESAIVLMSAVNNMCPDTTATVVGWARANGYTGPA